MNNNFVIIEAPSILGLKPSGVEKLPEALKAQGLVKKLHVGKIITIVPPLYNSKRDQKTNILNPESIHYFSVTLANIVQKQFQEKLVPLVLGGDCSILIGCLLALRRLGRYGLFFIDGHADFYQPEASPTGEVADMDLAIVTGRGPNILANIENLHPLVKEEDVVAFGFRDYAEQMRSGSQDIKLTNIHSIELSQIKKIGLNKAVSDSLKIILDNNIEGFWIHLDVDVLDDKVMSAVDYRLPGGLSFDELSKTLSILHSSQKMSGMSISIFNPTKDLDGSQAQSLVDAIVEGLKSDFE